MSEFEIALAKELRAAASELAGKSDEDTLCTAGVGVDIPTPPKFEDVDKMVVSSSGQLA